jgi:hypothetical protein
MLRSLFVGALASLAAAQAPAPALPQGTVQSAYDLLERVLPGSSAHFSLSFAACGSPHCFTLSDAGGKVAIAGTSASQLTAAIGLYFREYCNMTIGWPRGGGSNVFTPAAWPTIGAPVTVARTVPYNYIMNVCTHSYSLWTYTWPEWSAFSACPRPAPPPPKTRAHASPPPPPPSPPNAVDWMALTGINLFLAMTGQEEVQYKVFTSFGLDDATIRSWFNGPALLTWSRGQNEYGNNIAGPLPRSWMQAQWQLQLAILNRTRPLGMTGQLPAFQGNVPAALKALRKDSNMTIQGDTAWMDSLDPLFAEIADKWMEVLIGDFGTDHWYQLDGYFDGGTAPWLSVAGAAARADPAVRPPSGRAASHAPRTPPLVTHAPLRADAPACAWSPLLNNTYLAGCDGEKCESYPALGAAQAACVADATCGGVTLTGGAWQLRAGTQPLASPVGESALYITNFAACRPAVQPDPSWVARGAAAFAGLTRTDPAAVWSFQGWAIIDWDSPQQAASFGGFVAAVPKGRFVVIDMSVDGEGEWHHWSNASFFGAPFIWTTLHDFGGTDGLKGDLARINGIPWDGLPPVANSTVWGTGYTPEGIDQNPVYYEFIGSAPFRAAPVADLPAHVVARSHRRYGLTAPNSDVAAAWALLVNSSYSQDLSVQDGTGIPHLPGSDTATFWEADRRTPLAGLCKTYAAWKALARVAASGAADATLEPLRYDVVNTGREILARLSSPMSLNFSEAFSARTLDAARIQATGDAYVGLLLDADALLATDTAFMLGPWVASARAWGANNDTDCPAPFDPGMSCASPIFVPPPHTHTLPSFERNYGRGLFTSRAAHTHTHTHTHARAQARIFTSGTRACS